MMPGAGFFYYHTLRSFSCPMGGKGEPITICFEKGRCSPHPPRRPIIRPPASLCTTTICGIRVRYSTGAIGPFWPHRTEAIRDPGYELPRIHLLKLSEKGSCESSSVGYRA